MALALGQKLLGHLQCWLAVAQCLSSTRQHGGHLWAAWYVIVGANADLFSFTLLSNLKSKDNKVSGVPHCFLLHFLKYVFAVNVVAPYGRRTRGVQKSFR